MPQVLVALFVAALAAACGGPEGGPDAGGTDAGGPDAGAECTTGTDCPGEDGPCSVRTCESGRCVRVQKPDDQPAADQTAGDCKEVRCDGAGGTKTVASDDPPASESVCQVGVCDGENPTFQPVNDGDDCGEGRFCSSGACVACELDEDCGGGTECFQWRCVDHACSIAPTEASTACPEGVCDGSGACVQCLGDEDCGPAEGACQRLRCVAETHACVVENVTAGEVVPDAAGNCRKTTCDENGNAAPSIDPSDTFDDGNPCTSNACTNDGVPVNPPLPERTQCGESGLCSSLAACVACLVPTDCPGTDSFCAARTCVAGVCGVETQPQGTALPPGDQVAGDCRTWRCETDGTATNTVDDTDRPTTAGECGTATCVNGTASTGPAEARTACTGGLCDGAGACVACLVPTDCPGTDSECRVRTCTGHACGFRDLDNGTTLATQTARDCKVRRCDGSGNVVQVADPSDPPNDNNQCTIDGCNGTTPTATPSPQRTACTLSDGGSGLCNGSSSCVTCLLSTDCPGGGRCTGGSCQLPACNDNLKNGLESAIDCGGTQCPKCTDGLACTLPSDCSSGVCTSNTCRAPTCTDGVKNGTEESIDCGSTCPNACARVVVLATGADGAIGASWLGGSASWNVQLLPTKSTSRPGLALRTGREGVAFVRFTQVGSADDQGIFRLNWADTTGFATPARVGSLLARDSTPVLANGTGYASIHHGTNFEFYEVPLTATTSSTAVALNYPGSADPGVALQGSEFGVMMLRQTPDRIAFLSRVNGTWGGAQDSLATDANIPPAVSDRIPPALTALGTTDFLGVYVGANSQLRMLKRTAGTWSAASDVPQAFTRTRPTLLTLADGTVVLAFRGLDSNLYVSRYTNGSWQAVPTQAAQNIVGSPALSVGLAGATLEAFAINGNGGNVVHVRELPAGWGGFEVVGGANLSGVVAVTTP